MLSGSSGQAQEQAQTEQGGAGSEQKPTFPFVFQVDVTESQAEAESSKRREAEARQREIDDLIAQQGMNAATQAMRQYSYVQTWLIGIGTALLIATLWLTIKANNSARDAVQVAREIGQAQTRAYLSFKVDVSDTGHNPDQNGILVTFAVNNSGASPAIGANIYTHIRWYPVNEYRDEEIVSWQLLASKVNIGAQGMASMVIFRVPTDVIQATRDSAFEIEISAKVCFFDVFAREGQAPYELSQRFYLCGSNFSAMMPFNPRAKQIQA